MDAKEFQEVFGRLSAPALLKTGEGWLTNPAAQALGLTQAELDQLEQGEDGALLWLARQFYHVSAGRLEGGTLVLLQPDVFLASAALNLSSQLRDRLTIAFSAVTDLSKSDALRHDLRARERLAALNQELYRIFRMVTQLERCAAASPLDSRMSQVDMGPWFDHLSGEVQLLCQAAKVEFTAERDTRSPTLSANRRQLDYMILSLISNAMKSLPETGGWIRFSMKEQADQVILTLADNAGGFSPDYLTHPLWTDPLRLLRRRGLGLGLPLVQRITADHDGTLMVFPSDKGTRVVISLPVSREAGFFSQPEPRIEDAPGFSMAKILLSDALPSSMYFPNPYGDDE